MHGPNPVIFIFHALQFRPTHWLNILPDFIMWVHQPIFKTVFALSAIFCFLKYSRSFVTLKWNVWFVLQEMSKRKHLTHPLHPIAFVNIANGITVNFKTGKEVRQSYVPIPFFSSVFHGLLIRQDSIGLEKCQCVLGTYQTHAAPTTPLHCFFRIKDGLLF